MTAGKANRVLAVASGGGHWEQLMALSPSFAGHEVNYVTTLPGLAEQFGVRALIVPDCNRNQKVRSLLCLAAVAAVLIRVRPDVIVTTGALPGYFAVLLGRRLGARTMWIDSIANAEEPSMAGRLARRHCDRWLTQWPGVAEDTGAEYRGAVL
ncbi:Oligosaccharide biosynthesis protein Alg14 like protein [Tsuneonella dongtanensis]|uniref:Oligosaccharide biosynthesis protein Alg14 like protein n=1 Tax=Tsuneonella dongtanensis TaxID=692370 RepID=A0A1B2ABF2_9SPHN|nr:glycosyl transferase [Tsuneonella dongtanensis]ANY19431.1 Oligosaccharide biosynthesis protein Alg14 like protein [Tsuneonella dongtanensis]